LIKEYRKNQIRRHLPHIAAGHFGIVYKGNVSNRKDIVAIKDIRVTDYTLFEEWKREVEFMSQHKNTFIVQVYGFCCSSKILTIVMEYMEKGSLFDLLHGEEARMEFNHFDRLRMARQVALGVAFLHANKILHRDIKSLNILVSKNRICKLADFGSAKLISLEQLEYYTADVGTPLWMAPEVRYGKAYSLSADIFSLGVVLYEIFENKLPDYDKEQMVIVIHSFNFPAGPLISPMLNLNPKQRPSGEDVAKQLNNILQYVVEKVQNGVDMDSLMSQQSSVLSKESQIASAVVTEGFNVLSKHFYSQSSLSGTFADDDDDLLIVNNPNPDDYDYEDDDEDEFEDMDDTSLKRFRAMSLSQMASAKVNPTKVTSYNTMNPSALREFQQGRASQLEPQFQAIEEEGKSSGPVKSADNEHTAVPATKSNTLQFPKKEVVKNHENHVYTNPQYHVSPQISHSAITPLTAREKLDGNSPEISRQHGHKVNIISKQNGNVSPQIRKEIAADSPSLRTKQGLVLYSFEPENPGELAVEADDIIEVITVKGEWVECLTEDRRHGWVPFNYVQIQDEN
jgi:serine/threonine protein kinase